jgi:hypothetical protein
MNTCLGFFYTWTVTGLKNSPVFAGTLQCTIVYMYWKVPVFTVPVIQIQLRNKTIPVPWHFFRRVGAQLPDPQLSVWAAQSAPWQLERSQDQYPHQARGL